MSVFRVILVRIFAHLNWILIRTTPNTETFYAVLILQIGSFSFWERYLVTLFMIIISFLKVRKCQSSSIFSNVQANNIQLSKWTNVNSQSPWNKQNEFSERCQIWFRASLKAIPFTIPAGNYMFKVNNRNTRTRCEICSKLTIKIPERCHWRRSGILIANFGHILHLVLVFLLLTLNM